MRKKNILREKFNTKTLLPILLRHFVDKRITSARHYFTQTDSIKKRLIQEYNERLISRFYESLDSESRDIEKLKKYSEGSIKELRRKNTKEVVERIRLSQTI